MDEEMVEPERVLTNQNEHDKIEVEVEKGFTKNLRFPCGEKIVVYIPEYSSFPMDDSIIEFDMPFERCRDCRLMSGFTCLGEIIEGGQNYYTYTYKGEAVYTEHELEYDELAALFNIEDDTGDDKSSGHEAL